MLYHYCPVYVESSYLWIDRVSSGSLKLLDSGSAKSVAKDGGSSIFLCCLNIIIFFCFYQQTFESILHKLNGIVGMPYGYLINRTWASVLLRIESIVTMILVVQIHQPVRVWKINNPAQSHS